MHSGFKRRLTAGVAALMSAAVLTVPAAAIAENAALAARQQNAINVLDTMGLRRGAEAAEEQIDFSLKDASAAPGQLAAVSAVIGSNSGCDSVSVSVVYPNVLKAKAPEGAPTPVVVNESLFPDAADSASVLVYGDSLVNYSHDSGYSEANGTLFDIFFLVPEDAVPGTTYEITMQDPLFWNNGTLIPVAAKSAVITVVEPPPKPKGTLVFEAENNQLLCWAENQDTAVDLSDVSVKLSVEEDGVRNPDFTAEVKDAFEAEITTVSGLEPLPSDKGFRRSTVDLIVKDVSVLEEALKNTDYEGLVEEQGIQNGDRIGELSMNVDLVRRCDTNLDGRISLNDALDTLRYYTLRNIGNYDDEKILTDPAITFLNAYKDDKKSFFPFSYCAMDANDGNGVIGLDDAQYILKYYTYYVMGQIPVTSEPMPAVTMEPETTPAPETTQTTAVTSVTTEESTSASTASETAKTTVPTTGTHSETEATQTTAAMGLDISQWQGDVDFKQIKDETDVDFIIVRAGMGRFLDQEDTRFRTYYNSAKAQGFKVGAYWYSYAMTPEAARIEANVCLQVLGDRKFEYPIVLDIEEPAVFNTLTPEVIGSIITAFCDEIEKGGCYAMVYCSPFWYNNYVPPAVRTRYDLWIAHWDVPKPAYTGNYGIWQYHVGPFTGFTCDVDQDYSYRDYEEIIKKKHLNGY